MLYNISVLGSFICELDIALSHLKRESQFWDWANQVSMWTFLLGEFS